jgi:hypothetical protein
MPRLPPLASVHLCHVVFTEESAVFVRFERSATKQHESVRFDESDPTKVILGFNGDFAKRLMTIPVTPRPPG